MAKLIQDLMKTTTHSSKELNEFKSKETEKAQY